ncbi:MAG TPA: hypothetical protein VHM02_01440 [Thermoanaerobaculia bacterium]|nr:hypothetical protein [Thermoanaerobaculia bacterium]
MSDPVELPLWLAVVLAGLAAWALLERLLVPGVRWFLRPGGRSARRRAAGRR